MHDVFLISANVQGEPEIQQMGFASHWTLLCFFKTLCIAAGCLAFVKLARELRISYSLWTSQRISKDLCILTARFNTARARWDHDRQQ